MDFKPHSNRKWFIVVPASIVIIGIAVAAAYFYYRYDQASQPETQVVSSDTGKDNGNGIALPGLADNGQNTLGTPTGDNSGNSVTANGAGGTATSQPSQSQPSAQPNKPVRSQTLPNGLKIDEFSYGSGDRATKAGDTIAAHYIGYLPDGKVFDTSLKGAKQPFAFKLGAGQVIAGWDIGLQDMHVGAVRRLYIPAALAYGSRGAPPNIPPNANLVFDVQLMGVQ